VTKQALVLAFDDCEHMRINTKYEQTALTALHHLQSPKNCQIILHGQTLPPTAVMDTFSEYSSEPSKVNKAIMVSEENWVTSSMHPSLLLKPAKLKVYFLKQNQILLKVV